MWAAFEGALSTVMREAGEALAEEWRPPPEPSQTTENPEPPTDGLRASYQRERRQHRVPKGTVQLRHTTRRACSQHHTELTFKERRLANTLARVRRLLWLEERGRGAQPDAD